MKKISLKSRVERIFQNARGVDVILILNTEKQDPNFLYLTDMPGELLEGAVLIVTKKSVKLLAAPADCYDVRKRKPSFMRTIGMKSRKQVLALLKSEIKGKRLGLDFESISHAAYRRITRKYHPRKTIDISSAFASARLVKDDNEIEMIRKAARITGRSLKLIEKRFKIGVTEKELAREFEGLSAALGANGPSFPTIVSFGPHTALAHHYPDNTKLRYGDIVLIDAGSKIGNYCSDMTRTFIFGTDKARIKDYNKKAEIINLVRRAQRHAIRSVKIGDTADEVHKRAEDMINSSFKGRYKDTSMRYRGHSLGIEVHDAGNLVAGKTRIKENMVLTIEPGIYLIGFGGARFEDDLAIKKKGAVIL